MKKTISIIIVFIIVFLLATLLSTDTKDISVNKTIKADKTKTKKSIPKTSKTKSVTIVALGDVMFDRQVKVNINSNGEAWPFAKVSSYLESDITFANLESSLSTKGEATADKDVVFQGTPIGAKSLYKAGIDVVSLANNHALDYGSESLKETRNNLDKQKIAYIGAGLNKGEAYKPVIEKVGDLKVGFLAFSDVIPFNSFPSDTIAGIAPARDPKIVADKVKALAQKVDLVIVSFHWGQEYKDYYAAKQKVLATASIDAGADLILGHHPHVTQGITIYKEKLIFYSLGNFLFDRYKSITGQSMILKIQMQRNPKFNKARIWPVQISSSGQPQVVKGYEAKKILSRIKRISKELSGSMKLENDSFVIEQ